MKMDRDFDSDRASPRSPILHERDMHPMLPHPLGQPTFPGSPPSPTRAQLHPGMSPPSPNRPPIHPGLYPRSSPLPLHLAFDKTVYSSPPQASNKPENNQCHLLDYRGAKVATFHVERREMICLPQAFELFLKHLVGGLHTVYTKLKRLGITPVVCNVEQVRILRGLGAIQPGVNRCKLIAPKEFDVLYEDCTNSSARPGRPPKRGPMGSPDSFENLKKSRTEGDFYAHVPGRLVDPKKPALFPNGYHFPPYHLPFMSPLTHPAMMNLAMANHLGMRPDMIHARDSIPADLSTRRPIDREDKSDNPKTSDQSTPYDNDKPLNLGINRQETNRPDNIPGMPNPARSAEMIHNSQFPIPRHHSSTGHEESDLDDDLSDEDDMIETDEMEASANSADDFPFKKTLEAHAKNLGMALPPHVAVNGGDGQANSAVETLLMNILGLLKVAIENARLMEEQAKHEKSQIKMDLLKEKETREQMEKQLEDEQKHIALLTKKLKRERRTAKRLQDQLEQTSTRLQPPCRPSSLHNIHEVAAKTIEDDFKQAQEDLKKLNEISNRMSPLAEDRKSFVSQQTEVDQKPPTTEPTSTSDVPNAMESLIMSTQRLPSSCHTANGYLHSPIIKQAEAV